MGRGPVRSFLLAAIRAEIPPRRNAKAAMTAASWRRLCSASSWRGAGWATGGLPRGNGGGDAQAGPRGVRFGAGVKIFVRDLRAVAPRLGTGGTSGRGDPANPIKFGAGGLSVVRSGSGGRFRGFVPAVEFGEHVECAELGGGGLDCAGGDGPQVLDEFRP